MLVAGVDSSTQSTKVLLCEAEDGTVVARGSAPHPPGTECDPAAWWSALEQAGTGLLDRADAIAVAAQQHGMVVVDEAGEVIRPALLWNDLRSAPAARELIAELGGPGWWAEHTGSVPSASFTVTKLRWLATHEPGNAARVARVMLPHDWLTWRLASQGPGRARAGGTGAGGTGAGGTGPGRAGPVTDRGDASGTGYFSPATGRWLPEVAAAALGHEPGLPRIARPHEIVGETAGGAVLAPGTGDNMGAALGLGLEPGELVVSIGTSGTAYAVTERAAADESGMVAGFADATGRFLPLIATVNAGLVLSAVATLTGTDLDGLSSPGAGRGAWRGRHRAAALPGRGALPEPARRDRGAPGSHHAERDARQSGPGRDRGRARHAGRGGRPDRGAGRVPRAGAPDRRRGPLRGRPPPGPGHLRGPGPGAGA